MTTLAPSMGYPNTTLSGTSVLPESVPKEPRVVAGALAVPAAAAGAAAVIVAGALVTWLAAPPETRDGIVRGAADKVLGAAKGLSAPTVLPAKHEIVRQVTELFRGIERARASASVAGSIVQEWCRRLVSGELASAPANPVKVPPILPSLSRPGSTVRTPTVDPNPAVDPVVAQAKAVFSTARKDAQTANDSTNRLRSGAVSAQSRLQASAAQFYWSAAGGRAALPKLHTVLQAMEMQVATLRRLHTDANMPVSGLKNAYARMNGAMAAPSAYGLGSHAAKDWSDVGRWSLDADAWRTELNEAVNAFAKWVGEAWKYVSDATHRPGQAQLPALPQGASGAVSNAAQQARANPLTAPLALVSSGNEAGGGAGAIPPSAATPASPQPPPGGPHWSNRMIKGAVISAMLKGAAYVTKHRDKSPAELARDPGLWIAMAQGGLQGAALGFAVNAKVAASIDKAQIMKAIKYDFVFSGLISGGLQMLFKLIESDVDLTDPKAMAAAAHRFASDGHAVGNTFWDFAAIFLDAGTDWAALGSVPSAVFPVPRVHRTREALINGLGVSKLSYFSVRAENYWKPLLSQTGLRFMLGSGNNTLGQLAGSGGDFSKVEPSQVLFSGLASSLYPAVMQSLHRVSLSLSQVPWISRLSQTVDRYGPIENGGGRVYGRVLESTISDTNTPVLAYGSRAVLYGASIALIKRELSKGEDPMKGLKGVEEKAKELLRDPDKLAELLKDPEVAKAVKEFDSMSLIEKASLLGGYVPSEKALKQLDTLRTEGADLNKLLAGEAQPLWPQSPAQWADPQRVNAFHRGLDAMIDNAYGKWRSSKGPG